MTASDAWLGPVHTTLYEPSLAFSATPTAFGIQLATITGMTEWLKAHQLDELVGNPARRITAGGQTGVAEHVWFEDDLLGPLSGPALLQSFQLGQADQSHSLAGRRQGLVPYTLTLALVGPRTLALTHSARDRTNVYGVTPKALVVAPFWSDGSAFTTRPTGTRFVREYDPTTAYVWTDPAADAVEAELYQLALSSETAVLFPALEQTFENGPPRWMTDRGSDCRGYDRRQGAEVYGPHHFVEATDVMVDNGILRAWVGNRGLVPFLNVEAFRSGQWRQVGTLQFGSDAALTRTRLVYVTGERATIALTVQGYGDISVSLRRAARGFEWTIPNVALDPHWEGTPPTSWGTQATTGPAKFDTGLNGGRDDATWDDPVATWDDPDATWGGDYMLPDLRFLWPPTQAQDEWSKVLWLRPFKDVADTAGSGYLTIAHADGARAAVVFLDTDNTVKFRVGASILTVPVAFSAGDDICVAVRFSTMKGMALSVAADAIAHAANTSATTAVSDSPLYDWAYLKNDLSWGDGSWGDGQWGGVTSYPDAVVDNDLTLDRWLTDAEFEVLVTASTPLDGIEEIGDVVHYLPFDVAPIEPMGARLSGRRLGSTDAWGLQRVVAYLTPTMGAAALTTTDTYDTPAAIHSQVAAENSQEVRVRA